MGILNASSINLLQQGMDLVWKKQQCTLENIANVETPGYKAKYVDFETVYNALRDSSGQTRLSPEIKSEIKVDNSTSMREDGNNVDTEKENLELARAQIQYEYLQSKISFNFDCLEHVITEGKK